MNRRRTIAFSIAGLLLGAGVVAFTMIQMSGTERVDMRYRGGWSPRAVYRLKHDVYLMSVNRRKVLQPPADVHPSRVVYSEQEKRRGLPSVDEYVRRGLYRENVLGFVRAGTTMRFDRVVREQDVWDATLDYWGTITSGEHAGAEVILDNLNIWDSGDAPRTPDPGLVEVIQEAAVALRSVPAP